MKYTSYKKFAIRVFFCTYFLSSIIVVFIELQVFPAAHEDLVLLQQRGRVNESRDLDLLGLLKSGIKKKVFPKNSAFRIFFPQKKVLVGQM